MARDPDTTVPTAAPHQAARVLRICLSRSNSYPLCPQHRCVSRRARQLMRVIERYIRADSKRQYRDHQARVALAAALVHDVGHGMFSHSFEGIGKKLNLSMARHESLSEQLIRNSEITEVFKELGGGFADDVASVIKAGKPGNLYDSVVSSQFDADWLDYMQRDRMMTGVESSGIDATWLLANLEVASVQTGADADAVGSIETLVLGPKTFHVAENYVLALFQLYPNVYFHKATKAAERVFASLILRLAELVRDGSGDRTALPSRHPICRGCRQARKCSRA
jgi:HD superfamily phosphohydrolase